MTTFSSTFIPGAGGSRGGCFNFARHALVELGGRIATWSRRRARRRAALAIDARTLADIGLIRAQVVHEAAKPFWRP